MVLTPRIKIELTEFQRGTADGLEMRIDHYIKTTFDGKDDSVVRVDISDYNRGDYREIFPRIRDEISRRCKAADWQVNYVYSGRDERDVVLELTPKKKRGKR